MDSDKYLCIRENNDVQQQVAIVDLQRGTVERRKIAAEGCLINSQQVLAVRGEWPTECDHSAPNIRAMRTRDVWQRTGHIR